MTLLKAATPHQAPLKKFALHSTFTCAPQASVYGKCILVNYTDVKMDMCREEFAQFRECMRIAMNRKR